MRNTYGVILAMGLGLSAALWGLKTTWGEVRAQEARANAAESRVEALTARFDAIDRSLNELAVETKQNQRDLTAALVDLQNIQPMEGDSDETLECLDLPVPGALDGILRRVLTDAPRSDEPDGGL